MTIAERFTKATKTKYPDIIKYKSTVQPMFSQVPFPVKYQINFIDGSNTIIIMTNAQYHGLRNSKWEKDIKNTGGLGYVKLIS